MKNKVHRNSTNKKRETKTKLNKNSKTKEILTFKNIIYTLLIISAFGAVAYFIIENSKYEERYASTLKMKTSAIVYSIKPIETLTQGRQGGGTMTIGYKIDYAYKVNGIEYRKEQTIKQNNKNNEKIKYIRNNLNTWNFIARYSSTKPEESYLTIE